MKVYASLFLVLVIAGASFGASTIVCPTQQADDDYVVQFPSPTSCSEFYKCDRGVPIVQSCPEGLHYNPRQEVCDYKALANCKLGY